MSSLLVVIPLNLSLKSISYFNLIHTPKISIIIIILACNVNFRHFFKFENVIINLRKGRKNEG